MVSFIHPPSPSPFPASPSTVSIRSAPQRTQPLPFSFGGGPSSAIPIQHRVFSSPMKIVENSRALPIQQ